MAKAEQTDFTYKFEVRVMYPGHRRKTWEVKDPVQALKEFTKPLVELDFLWAECIMTQRAGESVEIRQWCLDIA